MNRPQDTVSPNCIWTGVREFHLSPFSNHRDPWLRADSRKANSLNGGCRFQCFPDVWRIVLMWNQYMIMDICNKSPVFPNVVDLLNSPFFCVFQSVNRYHTSLLGLLLFSLKWPGRQKQCSLIQHILEESPASQTQLVWSSFQTTWQFQWTSVACPEMSDILFARGKAAFYCCIACTACCFHFEQWRTSSARWSLIDWF